MGNLFKQTLLFIAAMMTGAIVTSCSNMEEDVAIMPENTQVGTRVVGNKTPKLTAYIETNDVNPLNAGEYYFCTSSPQEEVVDHVILFASNIRGNASSVWLHHNPNQAYILANVNTLVRPLQARGIKVLLGLLGDHTGVGFANLSPSYIESFAQQVASCVNTYGLDGVDFDDEYARYDLAPAGLPSPSATIMGNLILRLRQLLPGKLITAFDYGYATSLSSTVTSSLNYMWPDFGCYSSPPSGFPNSKWAKLSIRMTNQGGSNPGQIAIQNCADNYSGYGALMLFNMRDGSATATIINYFASRVWGTGKTVCWTGTTHYKNYP